MKSTVLKVYQSSVFPVCLPPLLFFGLSGPTKISFETKTFTFCVEKTAKVCAFSFSASYALQLTFHGQRSEQILEQGAAGKMASLGD